MQNDPHGDDQYKERLSHISCAHGNPHTPQRVPHKAGWLKKTIPLVKPDLKMGDALGINRE
jgi:hypothetical protein